MRSLLSLYQIAKHLHLIHTLHAHTSRYACLILILLLISELILIVVAILTHLLCKTAFLISLLLYFSFFLFIIQVQIVDSHILKRTFFPFLYLLLSILIRFQIWILRNLFIPLFLNLFFLFLTLFIFKQFKWLNFKLYIS